MTYAEVYVPIMWSRKVRRSSWPIGCYTTLIPKYDPIHLGRNRHYRTEYTISVKGPLMLAAQCVIDHKATDWEVID